jgi:hypothetical protein
MRFMIFQATLPKEQVRLNNDVLFFFYDDHDAFKLFCGRDARTRSWRR